MNTSKNSNGWMWTALILSGMVVISALFNYWNIQRTKGVIESNDSTLFNSAREVVTRYIQERDIALEKLKQSDTDRADWKVYAMQAEAAYKNQIKDLKRIISDHVKAK